MGIGFMLDPAMDLDDFEGCDDVNVDEQVRKMAKQCGLRTPTTGVPKLTAEALKFKSVKRRGGDMLREPYSMSRPRDYWSATSDTEFLLLKKIAEDVFAIPTSPAASERAWSVERLAYIYINHGTISKDKVDLARHRSRPDSVIK
ncbi:uncharacterized protein PITG_20402 [Phytophthora infestans T30-4]|uniref:HAT C-terminal dimerisation domain-containing protein n=1 Tax=Phytophthora infestans (strain T30-4) TaxID=403677 RepID=D0P2P5_PHYIT|nr:uncharacterized protein PITG_20402 [Phytophthora infestans T30-4]EEY56706.1 conserved hypothetical protein [Phytophthora infestans T30-4]|eukprot:XP_002895430.1 conserved hypothetical protein [Phytophthora infestans T30-4]